MGKEVQQFLCTQEGSAPALIMRARGWRALKTRQIEGLSKDTEQ